MTLRGSSANAEGGWDAYKDAIGGPVGLLVALPGEDQGLWNGTGPSVVKDVFAAPRGGLGGEPSWGSWERSTRLLGHGMPWEESSGREGEVWMKGGPEGCSKFLLDLRRKLNMFGDESGARMWG